MSSEVRWKDHNSSVMSGIPERNSNMNALKHPNLQNNREKRGKTVLSQMKIYL